MLFEFFILGAAVAAVLLGFGWYALIQNADSKGNLFLIAGALVLLLTGIFAVVDVQGLEAQTDCVNATYEDSNVWDGYCNVTDLLPKELYAYADGVNIEDGTYIAGTLDPGTRIIDQSYYQVQENGANFNITWNFSWVATDCPEHFHWVGRYQGPANRKFDWYAYNWTASDWDYVGTGSPDVTASASDVSELLNEGCTPDYIHDTDQQIRMKMVTANSAAGAYYIYTDYIVVDTESTTEWEYRNEIVNCTRDDITINYTYGPCGTETMDFNFSQMIAIMMMLAGVGTMLGTIGWNKYQNNDDEDAFYSK